MLLRRDGDRCSWCGKALRNDVARHHRMRRREGGDRLSNVCLLHTACHRYVHANPEEAVARGVIVNTWDTTTGVPMTTWRGTFYLRDDGSRHERPPTVTQPL